MISCAPSDRPMQAFECRERSTRACAVVFLGLNQRLRSSLEPTGFLRIARAASDDTKRRALSVWRESGLANLMAAFNRYVDLRAEMESFDQNAEEVGGSNGMSSQ